MRRLLALLLLPLALTSCGDDDPGSPQSATGTYSLRSVNGESLPFVLVQIGADRAEVTGGSITLNADATFSDRTTFRVVEGGETRTEEEVLTGTYTRTNNSVTLRTSGGGSYAVSWDGGRTLTQTIESYVLLYRK